MTKEHEIEFDMKGGETILKTAKTILPVFLPTAGPVLWTSLLRQDMYTAGAYILIIGVLVTVGSLLSDIALAVVDPRVRFGRLESV